MHPRRPSTSLLLVAVILLAGLLAGCGGGDQAGNGSQDGGSDGANEQGGEAANKKGAPQEKAIALGTIKRVEPDRRKVFLKPNTEQQGKGVMPFKIAKNATITLEDKEAELADIKEGQQAQVGYIAEEKVNRATAVKLFATGEQPSGEGERTG